MHITASELNFQSGDYEAFSYDVGNDPKPSVTLIDLAFASSQQLRIKTELKFFFVFVRSSYLIEGTTKIQSKCIVSTVNFFS